MAIDQPSPNDTNPRVNAVLDAAAPADAILDVGCVQHDAENAEQSAWLHQHLYGITTDVVGIDILREDIAELREKGYNVRTADAEAFSLDREFDVIVAGELIEHLSDLGGFLESCRRHLTTDGRLVLTTPNPWAFVHLRRAVRGDVRCNSEHTCWLDERTLRQLLARHGFTATVEYIQPDAGGVTRTLYRAGHATLGATTLVATATLNGDD